MTRHEIVINGRTAAYWERNPQMPETIVLIHGFRGNHKGLIEFASHLPDFRVIVPDLPGYGESQPLDISHTLEHFAAWVDEFVPAIGLTRYHLWGHSYGGSIGLIQAVNGTHKPTTLIAPELAAVRQGLTGQLGRSYYRVGQMLSGPARQAWLANPYLERVFVRALIKEASPATAEEILLRNERDMPNLNLEVVLDQYFSCLDTPLDPFAESNTVPTLVIAGAKDILVPVANLRRLSTMMPRGELIVIEEQSHLAPLELPGTVATMTKEFIQRH